MWPMADCYFTNPIEDLKILHLFIGNKSFFNRYYTQILVFFCITQAISIELPDTDNYFPSDEMAISFGKSR